MPASNPPGDWPTQVRKRVRVALTEHEIKAAEVARRAGWSQSYLARRLTATAPVPFSLADLEAIAAVLDISPAVFTVGRQSVGSAA